MDDHEDHKSYVKTDADMEFSVKTYEQAEADLYKSDVPENVSKYVEAPRKPKRDMKGRSRNIIKSIRKFFTDDRYAKYRAIVTAVIFWALTISAPLVHYFTGWLPSPDELWHEYADEYGSRYTATIAFYLIGGMILPGIAFFMSAYAMGILDDMFGEVAIFIAQVISILAVIIHIIVIITAAINGVLLDFVSSILSLLAFGVILLDIKDIEATSSYI